MKDLDVASDLSAAAQGDERAWRRLVSRFAGLVWTVARSYRLDVADAEDVSQTVWLRLVEHLDRIRDPDHLGAWLATTARRESLRVRKRGGRELPTGEPGDLEPAITAQIDLPDLRVQEKARNTLLWQAFQSLSERCFQLLRMLLADPTPSYEEIGAALEMKVGSIGPTRARCLADLRRRVEVAGISSRSNGS